ncbi:MAG TPA: lysophospholipid transporter LplT [Patescibacteria group bacterium]|nr:lysophospholipid transporter LplT [Patescibacteria group bacterium]
MAKLSPLNALLSSQFLSAFVDNMLLFIVLAIIHRDGYPEYYLPFVQSTFLAAYILCSPWVGPFADKHAKANVLVVGNAVKASGVLLLALQCNPALSYGVVGLGAVIYSPAKYGILPLLTDSEDALLRANSKLESFTILAILSGSVGGGLLADLSINLALFASMLLYAASLAINTLIPKDPGNPALHYQNAVRRLYQDTAALLGQRPSHYSLIGTSSFWMASSVLRMIIFAWLPLTLGITSGTSISLIIAITGVGIALGATLTPHLIRLSQYTRTRWFGLAMGLVILAFPLVHSLPPVLILMLLTGVLGGIYIVPMNACLQQVGHHCIGAGKTIAVQNFLENLFMFLGVMAYTLASSAGISPNVSLIATGGAFLLLVAYLYLYSRQK